MGFVNNAWVQKLGGGVLERTGLGLVSKVNLLMLGAHKQPEVLRLIRKVRRDRRCLLSANELFIIHSLARAQAARPGAMAEVGVYDGGSARIICEAKGDTRFFMFDTFEGLPEGVAHEKNMYRKAQYASNYESVCAYVADFPNVSVHKGYFPESALQLHDPAFTEARFNFVHFDVDLYQSTLDCLEYFYPRMLPGAIMLSHDYSVLESVKRAFTEFLEGKPESLIEMPTTQAMIVKLPSVADPPAPTSDAEAVAG
jgi:hypothetical protein